MARPDSVIDLAWRMAYRIGYPLARVWWRLRRSRHQGALVAIHVGDDLLLVRSSYRRAWNLPGGGVRPGETPNAAARRELVEEIGLLATDLHPAGSVRGRWDGRDDEVHLFTLNLERLPRLRLDNREIVAARLFGPEPLQALARRGALTGPVALYVGRKSGTER
ncbi:NUDIX domain-containing protein [Lichenicoccus sp.]|uniref:NUDIX domain-containing protein n=1 Tax=Lichenicoccus sp. TaxID=2781899 RepID=UPI003D0A9CF4